MRSLLLSLLLLGLAHADCPPNPDSIPAMLSPTTFTCAKVFPGKGAVDPTKACNTCNSSTSYLVGHADRGSRLLSVGSLLVMPGCKYYGFSKPIIHGDVSEYAAGLVADVKGPISSKDECLADGFASYTCNCRQRLIKCPPTDSYTLVGSCTVIWSKGPVHCPFTVSVGTIYSMLPKQHMAISNAVGSEIRSSFFSLMATTGNASTTGFNWTQQLSPETKSEKFTDIFFRLDVESKYAMKVEQVVGECRESNYIDKQEVWTNGLRITDYLGDWLNGTVVRVRHARILLNGTLVEVKEEELKTVTVLE